MKKLLNTLYITTQGSYLHKERETLVVEQERQRVFQAPLHTLQNVFCFGRIITTPDLLAGCAEHGIGVAYFTENGKFQARWQGPRHGNVLLRRAQYREADEQPHILARLFIAAKLTNTRHITLREQRNHGSHPELEKLGQKLAWQRSRLQQTDDMNILRGLEGEAAAAYFANFQHFIRPERQQSFTFSGRNRRPPLDRVNALLSFAYALLTQDIASALQGIGLDPYVGFLHTDRPGRLSLALDLLEEFRAWWCDRFVLSLINRQQISEGDFLQESSGAINLTTEGRKAFFAAWQTRKQEDITHPYTEEKIPVGLLPHVQGQLLARYLREDMENYTPFVAR